MVWGYGGSSRICPPSLGPSLLPRPPPPQKTFSSLLRRPSPQLYACNDEETAAEAAAALGVDLARLLAINAAVYPGLCPDAKLIEVG